MSDFAQSWELSRKRFVDEIAGLTKEQLNWRLHSSSLSIGEMAFHVAGVETSFASQLSGAALDGFGSMLRRCATDGVVDDTPFPFGESQIDPKSVQDALHYSLDLAEALIRSAPPEIRAKEIKSALGPMISGEGAFARLGFHAAYHQGQAYLLKTHPGFPKA